MKFVSPGLTCENFMLVLFNTSGSSIGVRDSISSTDHSNGQAWWRSATIEVSAPPMRARTAIARISSSIRAIRPMRPLLSQHIKLPQLPMVHVAHRLDREQPGLADARLEVAHLGEFRARFLVDWNIEATFAHDQDALGAQCKLGVQPQVAEKVRHHGSDELGLQSMEVFAHR